MPPLFTIRDTAMSEVLEIDSVIVDPDEIGAEQHLEKISNGFIDLVEGVETVNGRYLIGAAYAAGYVHHHDISGCEGFFEKVGKGIKTVWEYIKNTFKKVFFPNEYRIDKLVDEVKNNILKDIRAAKATREHVFTDAEKNKIRSIHKKRARLMEIAKSGYDKIEELHKGHSLGDALSGGFRNEIKEPDYNNDDFLRNYIGQLSDYLTSENIIITTAVQRRNVIQKEISEIDANIKADKYTEATVPDAKLDIRIMGIYVQAIDNFLKVYISLCKEIRSLTAGIILS